MPHPNPIEALDPRHVQEKGLPRGEEPQFSDRRLYMQLQAFTGAADLAQIQASLERSGAEAVLYRDAVDPYGFAVLCMHEDPAWFTDEGRSLFGAAPFVQCARRPALAMFGRTYGTGREEDLEDWLLNKPRRAALDPKWDWHVWYPLRRRPGFALLEPAEQGRMLFEHAKLGMAYGRAGLATDIRLACYGMDERDNEFVLGLVSSGLHILSRLVQDMRKTRQTAEFIESLGPFFIGRVHWRSPLSPAAKAD